MLTAEQLEVFCAFLAQKKTEPPPQPETFKIREIVRTVYSELKKLRENSYSLRMLVRVFEENGFVITTNALSTTPLPIDSTTGVISMVL
jgi:hypothetical protein